MKGTISIKGALTAALVGAVVIVAGSAAIATPYTYGVMGDTQWNASTTNNPNTVAVQVAQKVNTQFVNAGVQAVFQVGDLTDNGSTAGLQSRLDANSNLNGIAFYGLRGNHEDNAAGKTFFQNNYMPTSGGGVNVEVAPDGISYAVTINGTKFVMLDILTADSTAALTQETTWMNTILGENDHTANFVLGHKNLAGLNHHDTEFQTGSNEDGNPAQQNAFFAALASHNAMYMSGHDHVHDLSYIASPDGQNTVTQLICASDSYKFYTPNYNGVTSRYHQINDELYHAGYYIFSVDGSAVNIDYYHSDQAYDPSAGMNETQAAALTFSKAYSWSFDGSPVPEPGSILALASGLVGLGGMVIRRKRA